MLYLEDFINNFDIYMHPYHATINLTNNCNLQCIYCFTQPTKEVMSLETLKTAIHFLYNNLEYHKAILKDIADTETVHITFFGGEPLLQFNNLIIPIIQYIEDVFSLQHFSFSLTTNGTLLTEQICQFCQEKNISILISFDGLQFLQEQQRPLKKQQQFSSYDLILKNIPFILKYLNTNVVFRSTLMENNCQYLYQNFLFFKELGCKRWEFCTEYFNQNWSSKNLSIVKNQILQIYNNYYIDYSQNKKPSLILDTDTLFIKDYLHIKLFDILQLNSSRTISSLCCNDSFPYSVGIGCKGDLLICGETNTLKTSLLENKDNSILILGDIFNGLNINKIKNFINIIQQKEKKYNLKTCKNECYLTSISGCRHGGCLAHSLYTPSILPSLANCFVNETMLISLINLINQLINENNQLINEYLRNFKDYRLIEDILNQPPNKQEAYINFIKQNYLYD